MTPEALVDLAVTLVDAVKKLVGIDTAKTLLTDDEVKRANAIADALENARFPKN